MTIEKRPYIGLTCAYTPLALIDAAGFAPFRILPLGNAPDMAGQILHDNLCPHVKRVLDRALADDLPELAGVVLLNSCDAMRRLADAWPKVRPQDRVIFIDLPLTADDTAVSYFQHELSRLADTLFQWADWPKAQEAVAAGIDRYNEVALLFGALRNRLRNGGLGGGAARLQDLYNRAVTQPLGETLRLLQEVAKETNTSSAGQNKVPIFLFGNVLPDPEAFGLFEACGARIVDEDLCTGYRVFFPFEVKKSRETLAQLAREILRRPRCARTLLPMQPGVLAGEVLARAAECKARGVIACTAKFCDPYIARLPGVRETLRKAGLPLLHIEGDCTMRSFGQHRTRIEAFTEMLRR